MAAAPIVGQSEQGTDLVRVVRNREVSERGLSDGDEFFEGGDIPNARYLRHALVEPVEADGRFREQGCTASTVCWVPWAGAVVVLGSVRRAGVGSSPINIAGTRERCWIRELDRIPGRGRTLEHRVSGEQGFELAEVPGGGEASRVGGNRILGGWIHGAGRRARGEETVVEPVG
ncbi:hypothetical protein FDF13_07240 [Brevibacterium sp. CS2]|nr:hypothetical protein FDF13_07240 [Brevibacterium sp. CS2]